MELTALKKIAEEEKIKTEKSLKREIAVKKELQDDKATLSYVEKLVEDSTPFPEDNPFQSFTNWQEEIKKQIKSSESSLKGFNVDRAFIDVFDFIISKEVV